MRRHVLDQKIALLLAATRRERDLTSQRSSATQTRASLLVGAAGLGIGSDLVTHELSWLSIMIFGLAALLGVLALLPDAMTVVRAQEIWDRRGCYTPIDVHVQILEDELKADALAAKLVKRRSILVVVGFALFVTGVGISTAQAVDAALHPVAPDPVQVEIVG